MVELELPRAAPARALAPRGFRSLAPRLRGGCTQELGTSGALQFQRILIASERCWQAYRPAEAAGGVFAILFEVFGFFDSSFEKGSRCSTQDACARQRPAARRFRLLLIGLVFAKVQANLSARRLSRLTTAGNSCCTRALKRFGHRELRAERRRSRIPAAKHRRSRIRAAPSRARDAASRKPSWATPGAARSRSKKF